MIFWFLPLAFIVLSASWWWCTSLAILPWPSSAACASRRSPSALGRACSASRYGETDYKVCLLPLGGYVKMTGETVRSITGSAIGDAMANRRPTIPGAFTSHPRWQRMLIGLAGPVANFLLAFVLMFFYFAFINEVPSVTVKTTTVEWVTPARPQRRRDSSPAT